MKLLYLVWCLLPTLFFGMALWGKLEQLGKKEARENPGDFFRQALYCSICVVISILADRYLLVKVAQIAPLDLMPLGVYQVVLLPLVLYLGAVLFKGSEEIRITKAPRPTQRDKRK